MDPDDLAELAVNTETPEEIAARHEEQEQSGKKWQAEVDRILGTLTPKEREVLERRFPMAKKGDA
jgi:DNA-directed RNA polymerase sigma subunit (sigma70/sigma32)